MWMNYEIKTIYIWKWINFKFIQTPIIIIRESVDELFQQKIINILNKTNSITETRILPPNFKFVRLFVKTDFKWGSIRFRPNLIKN